MKVVQINCVRNIGSTGKIVTSIHEYLNHENMDNYIIYGSKERRTTCSYSIYSKWESHLHSFLSRKLSLQGRTSFFATMKALKFLKSIKPDLVHLHNLHGHYINYEMLFRGLKKLQIPVVWTLHDCWSFTGKCTHYTAVGCKKWQTGCYDCNNLSSYPDATYDGSKRDYIIKKRLFNSIDNLNIVCVSTWLKKEVEKSFLKNNNIVRIYNGIDVATFRPLFDESIYKKYSINKNKHIVLGVSGVWKTQKGLKTFFNVASEISEEFQVILVGIDEKMKKEIPKNILAISRTENKNDLAKLYSIADVVLNASIEETFGMVTVEALACGTPVIVSNKTACAELIDDSTGVVVDMQDTSSVIDAIYMIQKRGKKEYSDNCINRVYENFTVDHMCKQYFDLYEKLL